MQSGIDSSRLRIAQETVMPTKAIEAREARAEDTAQVAANSGSTQGMFGEDGVTFRDVLDAINPLNHIPIVSDIVENVTGHKVSTASKLVGGTLLGGPIGFVASLVKVIFEDGTGMSPTNAVYAAVTGEQTTQVASAASATPAQEEEQQFASVDTAVVPVEAKQLAALAPAANNAALVAQSIASTATGAAGTTSRAVLDLYGDSTASAHSSYKKAQLLPYLRDVNTSKVL